MYFYSGDTLETSDNTMLLWALLLRVTREWEKIGFAENEIGLLGKSVACHGGWLDRYGVSLRRGLRVERRMLRSL